MKVEVDFKITDLAINEIKKAIEQENQKEPTLRISVSSGGCSGFSYGLGVIDSSDVVENLDVVEEFGGVKIVVDKKSLFNLDGVTLDWINEDGQNGFRFNNPNLQKKSCGCKKSSC